MSHLLATCILLPTHVCRLARHTQDTEPSSPWDTLVRLELPRALWDLREDCIFGKSYEQSKKSVIVTGRLSKENVRTDVPVVEVVAGFVVGVFRADDLHDPNIPDTEAGEERDIRSEQSLFDIVESRSKVSAHGCPSLNAGWFKGIHDSAS